MSVMKVLGRVTSSNVRKVLWAADELGLAYEREDWGLPIRDPAVPEFLALNPNAQVPVLIDGDYVLWESNAILTYLGRRTQTTLLPRDTQALGLVEQWLYWQVGELNPQWTYAVQALIRNNPAYTDRSRIDDSIARWAEKMRILEGHLAGAGDYVCGDTFTMADIAIGISVHRWFRMPAVLPEFPVVRDYYERLLARPAAAPWMSEKTP